VGRHDRTLQLPLRLIHKDFGLIIAAAEKSSLFMPATESAAVVHAAESASRREEDFSAVIRLMEQPFHWKLFPPRGINRKNTMLTNLFDTSPDWD
jgi:hypothetical protein